MSKEFIITKIQLTLSKTIGQISKSLDIKGYYFDDESNMLPSNRGGSLPLSKKGIDMTIDVLATAVVMTGVQEKKFLEHLKNARKKVK